MSVIIFIVILGILIFVHELGHFSVAKYFGIRVDEFGMGLPPLAKKLFSRNGTDYTLNWIPFGGFVKIYGEDSLDKNDPDYHRSLVSKPAWQQILVMIAGVTMNLLLAWVLFISIFTMGAPSVVSGIADQSKISHMALTVLDVVPGSPAANADIVPGDQVTQISTTQGVVTNPTREQFIHAIQSTSGDQSVDITITRHATEKTVTVLPVVSDSNRIVGVSIDMTGIYHPGFFESIQLGTIQTGRTISQTVTGFGQLITGNDSLKNLIGPVGLVRVVDGARSVGLSSVLTLMAIVSVNLAVINMVPFPALDGGRVLFIIIEKIIRRPLSPKWVNIINTLGFFLLIGLMVIITIKDIIKLF